MKYEKEIAKLKEWFVNEKKADEKDFDDFLKYCQERHMLDPQSKLFNKLFFSANGCERLYKEFYSPIKRTAKLLGLTYKELAEQIGYTENGLKNAVAKNQITDQLKKTLELLQENKELKNKLEIQNTKFNELKNYFKSFFLDF